MPNIGVDTVNRKVYGDGAIESEEVRIIDITAAEAARRIGVSRQAAVQWARSGKLGGAWQTEYSREWRIPEESVEQLRREREFATQKA